MDDNYKNALGKINLSESGKLKAKALFPGGQAETGESLEAKANMLSLDGQEKTEDSMKLKKIFKPAATLAACLALILTASAAIPAPWNHTGSTSGSTEGNRTGSTSDSTEGNRTGSTSGNAAGNRTGSTSGNAKAQNSLVITAYAQELTKTGTVFSGDYLSPAGGLLTSDDGHISFDFGFPIECKGKNIDTITYSIQNGAFTVCSPKGQSIVIDGEEIADPFPDPSSESPDEECSYKEQDAKASADEEDGLITEHINLEWRQYKSFTVDFGRQSDKETYIDVTGSSDMWDEAKLNQYKALEYDITNPSLIEEKKNLCDFLTKDLGITCTATYKDGTSETRHIVVSNKIIRWSKLEPVPAEDDREVVARCFSIQ